MSKSVTVPTNKGNPVVVYCNGKKYIYTAGETVTVPDEIAELFANSKATEPVIRTDTNDLEKIDALVTRVKKAEGDIADIDGKVTALENAFVIGLTPTAQDFSGTMDKTPAEIDAAIRANKKILFHISGMGALVEATQFINQNPETEEGLWAAAANITYAISDQDVMIKVVTALDSAIYYTEIYELTALT